MAICDIRGDGSVWLGHDNQIELLTVKNGRFHRKDLRAAFAPLGQAYIMTMTRYRGYVWLGTNDGIYIDDADKTRIVQGRGPVSLSQNYVTALCPTSDGRLLIGTLQGLDIYHPLTRTTGHWNTTSPELQLSSNFINCLLTANGQIWVGTESGGVNKLTPRLLSLVNYTHQPKTPGSLSPNCVNAMYVQRDGTLWVGTVEGGLNRKAPGSNTFVHYTTANSPLTHNSVSTLAADAGERTLWIGTWGGGICTADLQQGGAIRPLNVGPQSAGSLDFIGALAVDTLNRGLWVGTNTGLFSTISPSVGSRSPCPPGHASRAASAASSPATNSSSWAVWRAWCRSISGRGATVASPVTGSLPISSTTRKAAFWRRFRLSARRATAPFGWAATATDCIAVPDGMAKNGSRPTPPTTDCPATP